MTALIDADTRFDLAESGKQVLRIAQTCDLDFLSVEVSTVPSLSGVRVQVPARAEAAWLDAASRAERLPQADPRRSLHRITFPGDLEFELLAIRLDEESGAS